MAYYPPLPPGQTLAASSSPVVIASDNSPIRTYSPSNVSVTGVLSGLNSSLSIACGDANSGGVHIDGNYSGIISFFASIDGNNFTSVNCIPLSGGPKTMSINSIGGDWEFTAGGQQTFKVMMTSYTSGSANVDLLKTSGIKLARVFNTDPANLFTTSIISGALNPLQVMLPSSQTVNICGSLNPIQVVYSTPQTMRLSGSINPISIVFNSPQAISGSINPISVGVNAWWGAATQTVLISGSADSTVLNTSPVHVGGRVRTAVDTSMVANDAQSLTCTTATQLLTKPFGLPETDFQFSTVVATSAASISGRLAGAANVRNYVTGIKLSNSSNENIVFGILDGVIPMYQEYIPALTSPPATILQTPLRGSAATALNISVSGQANHPGWNNGGYLFVNLQGYQSF